MTMLPPSDYRVRAMWLADRLNDRDMQIIETVHRLHLVTGKQIEELFFDGLLNAFRVRKRVMQRLVRIRALIMLPRRVGGTYGGSGPAIYACDPASVALLAMSAGMEVQKRPRTGSHYPTRLHSHALAISELYVRLVVATRRSASVRVAEFATEPECWWPEAGGDFIKPDAYISISRPTVTDHWWAEIDLGTEHFQAITRKFERYVAFAREGWPGPSGVIPRVLVSTITVARANRVAGIVKRFPEAPDGLFRVTTFDSMVPLLLAGEELR